MVWDDLVSILRIEVMEDTPTTMQSCTDDYSLEVSNAIELVLDYQSPLNNTNSIELVLVNADNEPTPYVDNNSIDNSHLECKQKFQSINHALTLTDYTALAHTVGHCHTHCFGRGKKCTPDTFRPGCRAATPTRRASRRRRR